MHLTEIKGGKKIGKTSLREQCAAQNEGLPVKERDMPINELLTNFVLAVPGSGRKPGPAMSTASITRAEVPPERVARVCKNDYAAFERDLTPLLQRAA